MYKELNKTSPFFTNINRVFGNKMSHFAGLDQYTQSPRTNIIENEQGFEIQIAIPGFTKDSFNIELIEGKLQISFQKKGEGKAEKSSTFKIIRKEFDFSDFKKVFTLGNEISDENLEAKYVNGILSVFLTKKEITPKILKTVEIK